jgi:WhiB family redox-sensing transcriptional regulator
MNDQRWKERGACRDEDPEMFFPTRRDQEAAPRAVCKSCPVQVECLSWALDNSESYGVWGGYTEEERKPMRGARHRARISNAEQRIDQIIELRDRQGYPWHRIADLVGVHRQTVQRLYRIRKQAS